MPERKTVRAFLAIDLPPDVIRNIHDIQQVLKKDIRGPISWVRPEGIHLTLKFFGAVTATDIRTISGVVAANAAGARTFNLEVKGLGVFPSLRRPRVFWIGIGKEVAPLTTLQQAIDQQLEVCGIPREERPFRAHLTVARVKSPQGLTGLDNCLAENTSTSAGIFMAAGLTLFKSDLTPKGAMYTVLGHFPFQGA